MLLAVVLQLRSLEAGQIVGGSGRAVHGFWLKQWQATNPTMANALHQDYPIKPFTLSPLMGLPLPYRGAQMVPAGQRAWIRFTSLHPTLSQALLNDWLPHLPDTLELAHLNWAFDGVDEQHPWAGYTHYEELASNPLEQDTPPNNWIIELQTPTAFRVGKDRHLTFPMPEILVMSWLRRWQAFSPWPLDDSFNLFRLRDYLFIDHYDLKTVPVRYGPRLAIGSVGKLTLTSHSLSLAGRSLISLLADYAFFCGSGHHTTQGLGLTRRL